MIRVVFVLGLLLMLSAASLVTSQYQGRRAFIELERARAQANDLDLEWRRLQLERAGLARNARVDDVAVNTLRMVPVDPQRALYLNAPTAVGAGGS